MAGEPTRHASPDRASRSSFSSIREQESDLVQTFTKTKTSHLDAQEEAIEDTITGESDPPRDTMAVAHLPPPLSRYPDDLRRDSGLVYPARCFKGWKQVQVGGRIASKSYSDVQQLTAVWTTVAAPSAKEMGKHPAGEAYLEKLPVELLSKFLASLQSMFVYWLGTSMAALGHPFRYG
jgi:hypothetical protein